MRRTEGHFRGTHQLDLFYQTWWSPTARATLVVTHGMSEHSDCYNQFAERLNLSDWNIFAWDLRGHGRSEGKRGLVHSFDEYISDLLAFLEFLHERFVIYNGPVVLLGHSMGGLISLRAAIDHDTKAAGLVLSSPLIGLEMKVSPIKDIAARVLAKYLPDVTLHNELRFEHLSRDPQMLKAYQQDPLRHERASANLYLGMIEHMKYVNQNANRLRTPLLMQVAGHDMIVSAAASQAFFEKVTMVDKTLHVYTDSYHEIYNDLGYEAVFADLRKFLSRFVVPK